MKIHEILDRIRQEPDPLKRLALGKTLYREPSLSAIRKHARRDKYREAYRELYRFISRNRRALSLVPVRVGKDTARLLSGDRNPFPQNRIRIVTKKELVLLLARYAEQKGARSFARIEHLLDRADRANAALVIIDRPEDHRDAYRELSHDLHAWLMAGSTDDPGWKTGLLDNTHRRLDAFAWDERRTAVPLLPRVAEQLSSRSILAGFGRIRVKEWNDAVFLYQSQGTANGRDFVAYGSSLLSPEIAQAKCIGETVERAYLLGTETDRETWRNEYFGSGLAAGTDRDGAVLNAVYELIERDCLMTGYLNRIQAPSLGKGELEQCLRDVPAALRLLYGKSVDTYAFDITNDLRVPSVLILLSDRSRPVRVSGKPLPLVVAGIKADLNKNRALRGAAEELFLEWSLKIRSREQERGQTGAVRTRQAAPDAHRLFRFYTNGAAPRQTEPLGKVPRTARKEIKQLEQMLRASGHTLSYENVALPFPGPAGYHLVRARISGLQPLSPLDGSPPVSPQRLAQVKRYFRGNR